MKIPKWLSTYIEESDLKTIKLSLEQAESKTNGEIVPMVVARSSAIGHVAVIMLLLGFSLLLLIEVFNIYVIKYQTPLWTYVISPILLLIFVRISSHASTVQRLFTHDEDLRHQVESRAIIEFYKNGLNKTHDSTGVLIFVSLMEKNAVVLADTSIAKKLGPEVWDGVVKNLIGEARHYRLGEGFRIAIAQVGGILETHFPIHGRPRNELKNQLIIRE